MLSLDDEPWKPSERLLDLAISLVTNAPKTIHPILSISHGGGPRWFEVFPGEHYHLLTTLSRELKARTVWEFGTDTGMGTAALLEGIDGTGKVYTVDIDPIHQKNGSWLPVSYLENGQVTQVVSDMKAKTLFEKYAEEIADADLLFVDGPKDGSTEAAFLEQLSAVRFRKNPIVVFDDIRLMNMLAEWRNIRHPKMDFTSFGHWSGTGIVDWNGA